MSDFQILLNFLHEHWEVVAPILFLSISEFLSLQPSSESNGLVQFIRILCERLGGKRI